MKNDNTNACPSCGESGERVQNITVKHLAVKDKKAVVGDSEYLLCMNKDCDIVYFNLENGVTLDKQDVNVPIWFKKDADPKYACYCSKVTIEQIKEAVIKDGAKNMKDVLKITGAMSNSKCEIMNPLGKCCHKTIQATINEALML